MRCVFLILLRTRYARVKQEAMTTHTCCGPATDRAATTPGGGSLTNCCVGYYGPAFDIRHISTVLALALPRSRVVDTTAAAEGGWRDGSHEVDGRSPGCDAARSADSDHGRHGLHRHRADRPAVSRERSRDVRPKAARLGVDAERAQRPRRRPPPARGYPRRR